tara:strand:- start:6487 stop:7383 length:897 start_codon:yes stop_codon:yes gene_type:complete
VKKKGYFNCNLGKFENLKSKQLAILSVPTITHYKNKKDYCSSAPKILRKESQKLSKRVGSWDFDTNSIFLKKLSNIVDTGNFTLSRKPSKDRAKLTKTIKEIVKKKNKFLVIGGDDSVAIPAIAGLEPLSKLYIVQIDAHLDWINKLYGEKFGRSNVMRRASEMKWVKGMTQIGLRGMGTSKSKDFSDAKKWGSKIITDQKMTNLSAKEMLKSIPKNSYIYLTLDLDGLNPKEFPAVETRSPGGPGVSKIVEIIMEISKNKKFIGANVLEFAPKKDINNLSLNAAIRLIALLVQVLNR